ncbi:MAG: hypothetical protein ACI8P9_001894 [Parasphingorhabdus sp.]|jgi:hypothetical protein
MTRNQLKHAIRAACDVSNDNELRILGLSRYWEGIPMLPQN